MSKKRKDDNRPSRAERLAARREQQQLQQSAKRPYEGLAAEASFVVLGELLASAVATLSTDESIELVSVLPGAVRAHAIVNSEGKLLRRVALQGKTLATPQELARAIVWVKEQKEDAETADVSQVEAADLHTLIDPKAELNITTYDDFGWWYAGRELNNERYKQIVDQASALITPSQELKDPKIIGSAWLVTIDDQQQIRWVIPVDEDATAIALARIHANKELSVGEGSKFSGTARTHGVVVAIFDIDAEHKISGAQATKQLVTLSNKISDSLKNSEPLTAEQRRSRDTIRSRQITLTR